MPDERKVSPVVPLVAAGVAGTALYLGARAARAEEAPAPIQPMEEKPKEEVPVPILSTQRIEELLTEIDSSLDSGFRALLDELKKISPAVAPLTLIGPEELNRLLEAAAREGDTVFTVHRESVLVPAGNEVTVNLYVPDGYVDTERVALEISSDYYSPDLTLDVYVDYTKRVTAEPLAIYPAGVISVPFGYRYLKRQAVTMIFNNGSATAATVTYQVNTSLLASNLYQDWYRLLISYTISRLSDIAEAMGGRRL